MGRTVLIVDDHAGFRAVARRVLESAGFCVVGEAPDAGTALSSALALHPDLVLLDVQLPDGNGFDVAERLASATPAAQVVLTSSREVSEYRSRLAGMTARGFIGKAELSAAAITALVGAA